MKGNSLFSKYILFILGIISLMPGMAYSQTFKHYEGIANKAGDYEVIDAAYDCLRQKTHVYHYYIAIPRGRSKELSLPLAKYSGDGADTEPIGYFRWYNYDTDRASAQLAANSTRGKLQSMKDNYGIDKGLIAYNLSVFPNRNSVGVRYTRPFDDSWSGETIACDVSRYGDGCSGTSFEHEPTLSIRYIFHIMPAEKMADDIKQKLLETGSARDYSYEDGKGVSAGVKDASASMTLRLNQNDVTNYYFHPMKNINTHHVFAEDEAHQIKESDFSSEVVQTTKVQWRVYNSDKTLWNYWTHPGLLGLPLRFFDLYLDKMNSIGSWYDLNNKKVSRYLNFKYGDRIYVVAIAISSSGQMCPIANFTCQLFNQYPMTTDELKTASQNTRLNSYLDDHYRSVNTVSFDHDDVEQTLRAPTSPDDNQDRLPSKWSRRSYGFVYRDLINYHPANAAGNLYLNPQHSPLHGEYGLYKSANVNGWSGSGMSGTNGYLWWTTAQLYDRTYENTNGTQYGHFLYIDAADESRQIAEADFKADLFVVAAFRMLPESVWSMPKLGTFNLHAALLPQYRGAAPINWAVINGERLTGVTTFMIDKDIDTGGIMLRQECRIEPDDTAGDIHDKLMPIGAQLVVETVQGIIERNIETRVQRSFIQGSEVLKPAPKLTRELCHIDWNDTTKNVYNLIRGLSPYPTAFTELVPEGDETKAPSQLKIFATEKVEGEEFRSMLEHIGKDNVTPGTILSDGKSFFAIATADGAISIKDMQLAGKKRMEVKAFLAGFRNPMSWATTAGTSKAEMEKARPVSNPEA